MSHKQEEQFTGQKPGIIGFSAFNLPSISKISYPDVEMKLIETTKNLPPPPEELDLQPKDQVQQQQVEEQDSLAARIEKPSPLTTPSKKRKNGCICKKTFCLKMYCECFANGKRCTQECNCCNCSNTHENIELIEQARASTKDAGMHNCALSQKRCNCRKSNCQKKYCQCFSAGLACSAACKCVGCCNFSSTEDPQKPETPKKQQKQVNSNEFLEQSAKNLGSFSQFQ